MSLQITVTEEPDVLYQKVSIMVKGHDRAVLDSYELFTTMAAKELGITISNVWVLIQSISHIRLLSIIYFSLTWFWFSSLLCHSSEPHKDMERFTLLKSVHIFKKHRVQYEMRTHYRCVEVMSLFVQIKSIKVPSNCSGFMALGTLCCPGHLQSTL